MSEQKRNIRTSTITAIGLLTALVFVCNYIQIPIATGIDNTRIHLGNIMCLLAALLLGSWRGGLAAGLGSFFFDITYPAFVSTSWVTFILKFVMAFVCGAIAHSGAKKTENGDPKIGRVIIGTAAGALIYVALYLAKNYIENYLLLGMELETVLTAMATKGVVSLINAAFSIPAAVALNAALRPALRRANLADKMGLR